MGVSMKIIPVVGTVLVVVSELEAENIVHELNGDVVSEEDNVVSSSRISPQVGLGSLRQTGVPERNFLQSHPYFRREEGMWNRSYLTRGGHTRQCTD
jgi:hypothetical protein